MNTFELTGNKGFEYENPKPGITAAKCLNVIDGRWVKNSYKGQDKGWQRKIYILWEIEQRHTQGQLSGKHMAVAKEYTVSVSEKSNLRQDLESWRGRVFKERRNQDGSVTLLTSVKNKASGISEEKAFCVDMLINADCLLFIEHKQSDKGGVFVNVANVIPFDKEKYIPVPHELGAGYVPDWLAKRISERPSVCPAASIEEQMRHGENESADAGIDDDVPF